MAKHRWNGVPVTVRLSDSQDREVEIVADYSYEPAHLSGLPENCYPAEEDCEVVSIKAIDYGADVAEVLRDMDRITEAVRCEAGEYAVDVAAEEADRRYDMERDDFLDRRSEGN